MEEHDAGALGAFCDMICAGLSNGPLELETTEVILVCVACGCPGVCICPIVPSPLYVFLCRLLVR